MLFVIINNLSISIAKFCGCVEGGGGRGVELYSSAVSSST
jgi:hypothetical protein